MPRYIAEFLFRRTFPNHCERVYEFFSFLLTFYSDFITNINDDIEI